MTYAPPLLTDEITATVLALFACITFIWRSR